MTLQELCIRVFQDSGEPTNLLPYTVFGDETTFNIALPGTISLIRYINTATLRIANWKFHDGRTIKSRSLRGRKLFAVEEVVEYTGELTGTAGLAQCVLANDGLLPAGFFHTGSLDGWILETTSGAGSGQIKYIVSATYDPALDILTLVLDSLLDSAVDLTTSCKFYRSFFKITTAVTETNLSVIGLDSVQGFVDVLRVRDVTNNTDMARTYRDDTMTSSMKTIGAPTSFMTFGNELWFDAAPADYTVYEMLYMKNPAIMTLALDVPGLPEIYHEAIILWATHNIMRLNQDFNGAYATKRELEDLLAMLRLQGESDMDIDTGGLAIYG